MHGNTFVKSNLFSLYDDVSIEGTRKYVLLNNFTKV